MRALIRQRRWLVTTCAAFGIALVAIVIAAFGSDRTASVARTTVPAGPGEPAPALVPAGVGRCPVDALVSDPHALEGVTRELRRSATRVFDVGALGRRQTLTARTTMVYDVRRLGFAAVTLPGIRIESGVTSYYGRLARRLCGAQTASRSWLIIVQFGNAGGVQQSYRFAFFARTKVGWRVWYHN